MLSTPFSVNICRQFSVSVVADESIRKPLIVKVTGVLANEANRVLVHTYRMKTGDGRPESLGCQCQCRCQTLRKPRSLAESIILCRLTLLFRREVESTECW